ncbi:hypothetical protein Taro_033816 [Colocasia esculenta]|uniref:Uncharacterized protein n=1 Tax=Colocasia esculenta TaxID=4460 RepID=A0A843VW70_COLES|nr:hypothetical protein [Colocasia esculenta]
MDGDERMMEAQRYKREKSEQHGLVCAAVSIGYIFTPQVIKYEYSILEVHLSSARTFPFFYTCKFQTDVGKAWASEIVSRRKKKAE